MDTILDLLLRFPHPTPYLIIFGVLLLCGLGLPIPEDLILFVGGLVSYFGVTDLWWMMLVSYLGVIVGDSIIFWLGVKFGRPLTKYWIFSKLLPEDRLAKVRGELHKKGYRLIFAARFMPGLRAPIYFSSGTLHFPYRVFLLYDGLAALISVPVIIGIVHFFGDEFDKVIKSVQKVERGVFILISLVILSILFKWYITHRKLKRKKI